MEYTASAHEIIGKIQGVESIEYDALTGLTKSEVLDIKVDPNLSSLYGIPVHSVNEQMETALAGKELGYYLRGEQKLPVLLHLDEKLRNDLDNIASIPLSLPYGGSLSADKVVKLELEEKITTIARNFGRRYSAISIYLKDRDVGSFVKEARERIQNELKVDDEYEFEWGDNLKT